MSSVDSGTKISEALRAPPVCSHRTSNSSLWNTLENGRQPAGPTQLCRANGMSIHKGRVQIARLPWRNYSPERGDENEFKIESLISDLVILPHVPRFPRTSHPRKLLWRRIHKPEEWSLHRGKYQSSLIGDLLDTMYRMFAKIPEPGTDAIILTAGQPT